jgi:hypothetical protein
MKRYMNVIVRKRMHPPKLGVKRKICKLSVSGSVCASANEYWKEGGQEAVYITGYV